MQVDTMPTTEVPATSTLPDGNALGNDILAAAGANETAKLLRKTAKGGAPAKARRGEVPRIMFEPRGWTMGGRVD